MESKQKNRNEIPEEFKWKINNLVASDEALQAGMGQINDRLAGLEKFKGTLNNAESLLKCLNERALIHEEFSKMYVYANMRLHEDANDAEAQANSDTATGIYTKMLAAQAFIEPEILSIDEANLRRYMKETQGLDLYSQYLENLLRQKEHVLSAEIEEVLANAHEIGKAPDNIYSMLDNADIKFGNVKDEKGNTVELTHSRYGALLEAADREVRKEAWNTYYDSYWYLKNTLAAAYAGSVKKDVFFAKTRKYDSALDSALFEYKIPMQVYTGLIDAVHKALPQMHKYMKLRKKVMNLPDLRVYDLYAPMVKQIDTNVSYKEAVDTVIKSTAPLGEEYGIIAKKGLEGGWVDVYENKGKMNGAYSWGAYGGHPYILLNYEGKMDDMFTVAHELGHAMHSYYSWEHQPYIYSDYSIFLAEVASTVNEALLMDYLLKNNSDKAMNAYLVNTWLEHYRTTVFRQTMFAEFEMLTHQMAEKGEPLTLDSMNKLYRGLNEKYYGDEVTIDDKLDLEWARIPHFYRAFYVYQYATGYSAAMAFADKLLNAKDDTAAGKYREFLKSGSKDYPIEILKQAGVDMSQSATVDSALKQFGTLLTELEGLI